MSEPRIAGAPLSRASTAMILLPGRGAGADDIIGLGEYLALPDVALIAPEAQGRSWWPVSFLAPYDDLAPHLARAIAAIDAARAFATSAGLGPESTVLLGFSQGACLTLEYAARAGERFAGVFGLSGGLIGTADEDGPPSDELYGYQPKRFDYDTRLDGVPVFLGCHERDPHIPFARVRRSAAVFEALGARVETEIYPGAGHGVVAEEVKAVRRLLNR